jgi:hypothetical protein
LASVGLFGFLVPYVATFLAKAIPSAITQNLTCHFPQARFSLPICRNFLQADFWPGMFSVSPLFARNARPFNAPHVATIT